MHYVKRYHFACTQRWSGRWHSGRSLSLNSTVPPLLEEINKYAGNITHKILREEIQGLRDTTKASCIMSCTWAQYTACCSWWGTVASAGLSLFFNLLNGSVALCYRSLAAAQTVDYAVLLLPELYKLRCRKQEQACSWLHRTRSLPRRPRALAQQWNYIIALPLPIRSDFFIIFYSVLEYFIPSFILLFAA